MHPELKIALMIVAAVVLTVCTVTQSAPEHRRTHVGAQR